MLERFYKFKNKILNNRKTIFGVVLFCFVFGLGIAGPANAIFESVNVKVSTAVALLVGTFTSLLSTFFGWLLTVLIKILVNVAQFNDFVNTEVVLAGWVVVRDLCNMFFVLILLIIAFATILKIENYNIKRLLPKLLIMAVLINFSRTICGLIIDFSQVIMLTFVNSFAEHGAGNFINLFNVQNYTSIPDAWTGEVGGWNVAVAFIAGLIALIITNIVVLVMLAVLVMRIIMLWIYVILSPLAFLLSAFPAGAKYASQWWSEFSKQVVVGPILAFFLWLALTTIQNSAKDVNVKADNINEICVGPSSIFCEGNFQAYIITIGFLLGGIIITQQLGGITASAAGRAVGWAKTGLKWGGKKTWGGAKAVGTETLARAKAIDATKFGSRGAKIAEAFKHKEGAGTGAAIGTLVGGPLGTLVGAGIGAVATKRFSSILTKRRRINDARYNTSKETIDGKEREIYTDPIKNERHARFKDKYYKINGKGKFVDKDNNKISDDQVPKLGQAAKSATGLFNVKAMDEKSKTKWAVYATSAKGKGWAAKDAVEDEKISKLQGDYMGKSNDMLRKLLNIEQNSAKKAAISMALAVKKGFKDATEVNKAKDALGENTLLLKNFNDEMNQRHMLLNNTRKDGSLDEATIAKLISSGKADWKDQDWESITKFEKGIDLMAKQTGVKFHKTLESSIKTDKDKEKATEVLGQDLEKRGFKDEDLRIRKSYGSLSGDFLKAFNIEKGQTYANIKDDIKVKKLKESLSKISDAKVFGDVNDDVMDDSVFKDIFADSVNINMLRKIAASKDMGSDKINKYMRMAARNEELLKKMKQDQNLKSYVT